MNLAGPVLALVVNVWMAGGPCSVVSVSDGSRVCAMSMRMFIPGTESLYVAGRRVGSGEFRFDPLTGRLWLRRAPPKWTPLLLTGWCLQYESLSGGFARYTVSAPPAGAGPGPRAVARLDTALWFGSGLRLTGSKSLGLSAGTVEGVGLEQVTRLGVSGSVEGIEVSAELSDQNSPIPPEGTTRKLEELDRVAIDLKGRTWRGSFGDVNLSADAGSFGEMSRRAVGATAGVGSGPDSASRLWRVSAGYARPRGEYGRITTTGQDGLQGPYLLAPDGRVAQIVPGSEEVYLDGERVTRGWDADYTVDYSTGELLFTGRRVITRRSRIEAEFQCAADAYERSALTGGVLVQPGPVELRVGLFREGDDPSRSVAEELDTNHRRYLAGIGADTSRAWLPGARYVGAGNGEYRAVLGHYEYVGRGGGEFQVRFTQVGDSAGSYRFDDTAQAFVFVGPGAGSYVDSIRVVLPVREEVAFGRVGTSLRGLALGVEGVLRRRSVNLFSPGGAAASAGALRADGRWGVPRCSVEAGYVRQGLGLSLPGRRTERDFEYRWAGTREEQRRSGAGVRVRVRPFGPVEVEAEAGRLERQDDTVLVRLAARAGVEWVRYAVSAVSNVMRHEASVAPVIGWLRPVVAGHLEDRPTARDLGWHIGAAAQPVPGLTVGADWRQTAFDTAAAASDSLKSRGGNRLVQARLDWTLRDAVRAEGSVGMVRNWLGDNSTDGDQVLGSGLVTLTPVPGVRLQVDGSQTLRRVQLRDEQFRYVGPGEGEYRLDSLTGRYVYDPDGEYNRSVVPTGRFESARETYVGGSGELARLRPLSLSGSWSTRATRADSGQVSGDFRFDLRSDFRLLEPVAAVRLGGTGQGSEDRTLAVTGKASRRYSGYIEAWSDHLKQATLRLRGEGLDSRRWYSPSELDYVETGWRAEATPVLGDRLRLELRLACESSALSEPVAYPELGRFRLTGLEGGCSRSWGLGGRTRLRGSVEVAYRTATVARLPLDVALTRPLGAVPAASVEVEHVVSTTISLSGRYRFSDRPDRPADHLLSGEVRAFF